MNKEEMEKKRDLLSLISTNPSTSFAFRSGWDACAKEYEKEIERLNKLLAKQLL